MYTFGQQLIQDIHFEDHMEHGIPVQIYESSMHVGIGIIEGFTEHFIKVNGQYYNRKLYRFVSRPGY